MLEIPQNIKKIISILESAGYEAYVVGGAVRDAMLNKTPEDYDVTTSCPPEKIIELFKKTIPTGIKHGTVSVVLDGIITEVTTFRIDGDYTNHRSPESVEFTENLENDLSRRDFTVNAMAFNEKTGLIDLFSGKKDLENRLIRTVGNSEKRFDEDALRILRAIRFASQLNFSIESETYFSAKKQAAMLSGISGERIFVEISKTLIGDNTLILQDFINSGGLSSIGIFKAENFDIIDKLPKSLPLRFFAFLQLTDADFEKIANRLKFSNNLRQYIENLQIIHDNNPKFDRTSLKILLNLTDYDSVYDYLEYLTALEDKDLSGVKFELESIIKCGEPYKISMLDINGENLKQLGFSGEKIGSVLKELLAVCISEPDKNKKEKLIEIAKTEYSN